MKAAVTFEKGEASVIKVQEVEDPRSKAGWVLISIKAFGLNRSEIFTRQGHTSGVVFPRIQGIECVGIVEEDLTHTYNKGQKVAAIMGGMGREFDGSYAEYTLVPVRCVFPFESDLSWDVLGAIPEMFQTVHGSINEALELKKEETLLIRGGTSSIGMLSCQLAKHIGAIVISTSRNLEKKQSLVDNGADYVIIDTGEISDEIEYIFPEGVDKVLELIGTSTLIDSLHCIKPKGMVCMTGSLGNEWTLEDFTPMGDIPSLGRLTVYMGDSNNLTNELLQGFIDAVAKNEIKIPLDKTFTLDNIVEAHNYMESNKAIGKIVILVE